MAKNGVVAVLDIGSSKVVCFIAYLDTSGKIRIAGIGHQVSEGIRAGIIIDVKKAQASVVAAIASAEKMAAETIDEAIINISGASLNSHIINVETNISGHEVTDRDVNHIIGKGYEHFNQDELEIIHCLPIDYAIDDSRGIDDPRGMFGEWLSTELHVITASSTTVRNIANCLARCHLNIEDCVTTPYVSGLACLSEDEKNLGVTMLDIGAGNTCISIFSGGNCIYANSIALGGSHITRDIARGLSTSIAYAERVKTLYGSVISMPNDERETIDIEQLEGADDEFGIAGGERSYISKALLNSIIKPRMEEILEMAKKNVDASQLTALSGNRLVLTGGASQTVGLKELAGHIFGKQARVGKPQPLHGLAEATKGPAFSTAVGALLYAADKRKVITGTMRENEMIAKKGGVSRMMRWLQENF